MTTTNGQGPSLLDGIPDDMCRAIGAGLIVVAPDLVIREINGCARTLLDVGDGALVGRPFKEKLGSLYRDLEWVFQAALRTNEPRRTTVFFTGASPVSLRVTVAPVERGDEVFLLVHMLDVTEIHEAFARSAQADKLAAVGLLSAGVAHEFNNIWASVHGYAELARHNADYASNLAEVALEQSERASEIIYALLSFSDQRNTQRRRIPLGKIIRSVKRLVDMELRAKGIQLSVQVEDSVEIEGNEAALQQVLLNLLINASQAVSENGKVGITLETVGGEACIRVADNGEGMTPEQVRHIFEPFFTTKGALGGNESVDGHGLGLTLAYNEIQRHGGTIEVTSTPGSGTEFVIRLPLLAAEDEPVLAKSVSPEVRLPDGMRVLVVEDELAIHGLIRNMLPDQHVETVESGEEALLRLDRESYDVVLLDILLSEGIDGFEVLSEMQKRGHGARVIILTGRLSDPRLVACRESISGVLPKPFSMNGLRDMVARAAIAG